MSARRRPCPRAASARAPAPRRLALRARPTAAIPPSPGRRARSSCRRSSGWRSRTASGRLLVGMHEVPIVEVILVMRAGAHRRPGRAAKASPRMTADMLDEGAGGKDALALADAVDFLGATLATGAAWDASTVRLRVPVARLERGARPDGGRRPAARTSREAELERLRKEALTALLQARDEPSAIASRALAQARVRSGAPLRPAPGGRRRADRVLHGRRAARVPRGALRARGGDARGGGRRDARRCCPRSRRRSAPGRRRRPPRRAAVPAPRQLAARHVWLVDKKDAAQSSLRLGRVGPLVAATPPTPRPR